MFIHGGSFFLDDSGSRNRRSGPSFARRLLAALQQQSEPAEVVAYASWHRDSELMSDEEVCRPEMVDPVFLPREEHDLPLEAADIALPPCVVKVPSRTILDLMLQELDFPRARYDSDRDIRGRVSAVVTFYVSARVPGNLLRAVKIGGAGSVDSEVAEESAAREGIRFVESWEGMEVEDLHYSELRYMKETREDLISKLKSSEEDKENLIRGLGRAASRMVAFSNQMFGIAENNRCIDQSVEAEAINEPIHRFEDVAADLKCAGRDLKKKLRQLAKTVMVV